MDPVAVGCDFTAKAAKTLRYMETAGVVALKGRRRRHRRYRSHERHRHHHRHSHRLRSLASPLLLPFLPSIPALRNMPRPLGLACCPTLPTPVHTARTSRPSQPRSWAPLRALRPPAESVATPHAGPHGVKGRQSMTHLIHNLCSIFPFFYYNDNLSNIGLVNHPLHDFCICSLKV